VVSQTSNIILKSPARKSHQKDAGSIELQEKRIKRNMDSVNLGGKLVGGIKKNKLYRI